MERERERETEVTNEKEQTKNNVSNRIFIVFHFLCSFRSQSAQRGEAPGGEVNLRHTKFVIEPVVQR